MENYRGESQWAITYKDMFLSVAGAVYVKLIQISQIPGEHARLYAEAVLDSEIDENEFHAISDEVFLTYQRGSEKGILFKGIIDSISMRKDGDERILCLEAWDSTRYMDIERRSRAFQNPQMTIKQLVAEVMNSYENADYMINVPDVPIAQVLIQYEETDWEFLKRFFSKYHAAIYPDTSFSAICFQVGVNPSPENWDWDNLPYTVRQDFNWLKSMQENGFEGLTKVQGVTYQVDTYDIAIMGSQITYKGASWYIASVERMLDHGILINRCLLKQKDGLLVMPYFNQRLTGISVDGIISGVNRDKVQVNMEIDAGSGGANNYWFPFSTVASSPDGSGWYCMPEQGESIRVYFPVDDEKEGYVITNIKPHDPQSQAGSSMGGAAPDPMGNPNVRSISTSQGNQVQFTETGVVISAGDQGSVCLKKDGSVVLNAMNDICISAAETLQFIAQNELTITAQTSIKMINDAGADFEMTAGKIELHGKLIQEN